jgi:hypothetical protein
MPVVGFYTAGLFAVWLTAHAVTVLHAVTMLLMGVFHYLVQENNIPFSSSLSKQRQVALISQFGLYFWYCQVEIT